MNPAQVVLAALAMAFGAWVQGAVGFGGSLVASPLLVLIKVDLGPGPIGIAGILLDVLITRRAGAGRRDPAIRWAIVGVVPGTIASGATFAALSTRGLSVAFAILAFVAVGLTASGLTVRRTPRTLLGAGVIPGFWVLGLSAMVAFSVLLRELL